MRAASLAGALLLAGCAAGPPGGAGPAPGNAVPPGLPEAVRSWTVVDLTHPLDGRVPYWPGEGYFPFEAWDLARIEEVGAFSRAYRVPEHYGTHVDAPAHFAAGGATVEAVPLDRLLGPAAVFDIRAKAAKDPDAGLTAADVDAWEAAHGRVPEGAVALLLTGWGARWGDPVAYRNIDGEGRLRFPSYALDGARRLLADRGVRGLCVDTLSIDRGIDGEFPVHHLGSGMGRWFAENLANLERLPPAGAFVIVAAVPLRGGSGAQARVMALVPPAR